MDRLPSNIMFHIFSGVPAKSLARFRLVSKEWCKYIDDPYLMIVHDERVLEPIPILYDSRLSLDGRIHSLCFHTIESKKLIFPCDTNHTYVLEPKEGRLLEFLRKKPLSESLKVRIRVRGSCNGLICLSQDEDYNAITSLVVVHPLRKECYELPPLPMSVDSSKRRGTSCGLGFDASTNSLKMVCVCGKHFAPVCTLVHVFGTNSWREIPQVPSYPIEGEAIFYNGCLYWLVKHIHAELNNKDGGRGVIWFDVNKEEFGLIDPPERMFDIWTWSIHSFVNCQLVDLNGEVGYVCYKTMEVWVLKQKEWVPHCELTWYPTNGKVLGCWNKDGDMLLRQESTGDSFFIYNLKSGVLHRTNIVVPDKGRSPNIFMHPNTLSSIRGIRTNSFSMEKTNLRKSCQHLLSCY